MIIKNMLTSMVLIFMITGAKSQKIDSLKALLESQQNRDRIETLYQLSWELILVDKKQALVFALDGYNLAVQLNDSSGIVRTGTMVASALRRLHRVDSSLLIYNKLLRICRKKGYTPELSLLLNSAGIAYAFKAEYDKAFECYFEALRIRKETRDTVAEIVTLSNIGAVYYKLKNYKKAIEVFMECRSLQEKSGASDDAALCNINIGHAYAYLGNSAEALKYVDMGMQMCADSCTAARLMEANFVKGIVHVSLEQLDVAEKFFLKSLSLAVNLDDARFQLDNIDNLTQIYLKQCKDDLARSFLMRGEQILSQYPEYKLEKIKVYSLFVEIYRQSKDFRNASQYQLKLSQLKDSVFSEQLTHNLMRLEGEFLEQKNLVKIASQAQIIDLNNRIIGRQELVNKLILLLSCVSAGFVGVLFRHYLQKKRINEILDKKIAERTNDLQNSHTALIRGFQERDLHLSRTSESVSDGLKQIKALCGVGLKEVSDPVGRAYIRQIDTSTTQLAHSIVPALKSQAQR
jgi:tetratricopeptide (TPR) repeat protein